MAADMYKSGRRQLTRCCSSYRSKGDIADFRSESTAKYQSSLKYAKVAQSIEKWFKVRRSSSELRKSTYKLGQSTWNYIKVLENTSKYSELR